jgi:hypothetical protein
VPLLYSGLQGGGDWASSPVGGDEGTLEGFRFLLCEVVHIHSLRLLFLSFAFRAEAVVDRSQTQANAYGSLLTLMEARPRIAMAAITFLTLHIDNDIRAISQRSYGVYSG